MTAQYGEERWRVAPWRRFYQAPAAALNDPDPVPLSQLLDTAAAAHPERPCLTLGTESLAYAEVHQLVCQLATGLAEIGITSGDRVGYMAPAHSSFTICYFALWHLGAIGVGLNPLYSIGRLANQAEDSGLKAIVTLDEPALLSKATAVAQKLSLQVTIVVASAQSGDPGAAVALPSMHGIRAVGTSDLVTSAATVERAAIDPRRHPAVLQYTGGTTGTPKAAILTHANLSVNAAQMTCWFPQLAPGREVMLSAAPVTHVSGVGPIQNFTISLAGELVSLPRFDPVRALDLIEERGISILLAAPTMYVALLQAAADRPFDWSRLRSAQCGAGPVPPELKRRFQDATGLWITTLYGMTETSPAAVYSSPLPEHADATGIPLPFTEVEIRSPADPAKQVAHGELGEICIRGPQVMAGYWKRELETADAFVDGFFRSGDLGSMTADGVITVHDRLKDVIIAGGYNIYPAEVESAILEHPDVREVAVIGVPDAYRGETAKAIVSLRANATLELAELKLFLTSRLSPMEIPTQLELLPEIPKNENLKISRYALRERERSTAPAAQPADGATT